MSFLTVVNVYFCTSEVNLANFSLLVIHDHTLSCVLENIFLKMIFFLYFHISPITVIHMHPHTLFTFCDAQSRLKCKKWAHTSLWLTNFSPIHWLHLLHTNHAILHLKKTWFIVFSSTPHITHKLLSRIIPLSSRFNCVSSLSSNTRHAIVCIEKRVLML